VLWRTLGHKSEEVAGDWRRLRNLYASPNIIRVIKLRRKRWERHIARTGEMRSFYKVLVRKPEGKRSLGRHRRRLEDNIRKDLREIGNLSTGFIWLRIGTSGGLL
jgi:hypothetical protein